MKALLLMLLTLSAFSASANSTCKIKMKRAFLPESKEPVLNQDIFGNYDMSIAEIFDHVLVKIEDVDSSQCVNLALKYVKQFNRSLKYVQVSSRELKKVVITNKHATTLKIERAVNSYEREQYGEFIRYVEVIDLENPDFKETFKVPG